MAALSIYRCVVPTDGSFLPPVVLLRGLGYRRAKRILYDSWLNDRGRLSRGLLPGVVDIGLYGGIKYCLLLKNGAVVWYYIS